MRHAVRHARVIFTVSEFTKRDITKNYRVPGSKIQVTYNGIDLEHFRPISNSKRLQEVTRKYRVTKPFVLYVGQWMEHKNIYRLIDAFCQFDAEPKFHDRYQLVLVGQPRDYDEYRNRVAQLKAEKSIILTGFVDDADLPALYNAAKLFAFPSLSEGFGIPPVEAMACGTPVISSNATSLPEVLGQAALYFDPLSVDAIAKTLTKGLTDINLQRQLTQAGRAQAAKFSWTNTAQKTIDGYTRAL
jgi:glycosyltransferase involved in cell wall biosynthesis